MPNREFGVSDFRLSGFLAFTKLRYPVGAMTSRTTTHEPQFENVQAHYDLSDDFFALFLDPSMTYSCAYFERDDMTLAEAQQAKIDLALGKLHLQPGEHLLDIGCGWGATMRRAAEQFGVDVTGLTLSRNQQKHVDDLVKSLPTRGAVHLAGWEQFDQPVDAIVSIGAFEHFRIERYPAFFERCHHMLPAGGRMLLHTIVMYDRDILAERDIALTHENILFAKFIDRYIFPGGQLADPRLIERHARNAGFDVERIHPLQPHYARTLDTWAANLEARRDVALTLASQETYDTYQKYLTGCADHFRSGHIDVMQFTLVST